MQSLYGNVGYIPNKTLIQRMKINQSKTNSITSKPQLRLVVPENSSHSPDFSIPLTRDKTRQSGIMSTSFPFWGEKYSRETEMSPSLHNVTVHKYAKNTHFHFQPQGETNNFFLNNLKESFES